MSGSAGKKISVRVEVTENTTLRDRGLVLVVRNGSCEERLAITQRHRKLILQGGHKLDLTGDSQTFVVEVLSDAAYEVSVESGDDWLSPVQTPLSSSTPAEHVFRVTRNAEDANRTGVIRFRVEDSALYDDLTVVQEVWSDPAPERTALERLYESTGGAGWLERENWCSERPLGEWYGVETDAEGHVTALTLSGNGLTGRLPERILGLEHLERLDLSDNRLEGPLPSNWEGLSQLRHVDLSSNLLEGPIPEWSAMFSAPGIDLVLNDNTLWGDVPASLQSHADWDRLALQLIRQRKSQGGGLKYSRKITLPDFVFTDLATGARRSMRESVGANELTMLVSWDPTDATSTEFMHTVVRRLHRLFGAQGFAVVAFTPDGDAYRTAAERYLLEHSAVFSVSIGPGEVGGRPMVLPTVPYPSYMLFLGTGSLLDDVFEGNRSFPDRGDLFSLAHIDYLNSVCYQRIGITSYESTDFTMDGKFEVLQRATRGKGIDLVLMGDAFTDVDIQTGYYLEMMKYAMESYFAIEPTKSYRDYFTVYAVYAVSRRGYVSQSAEDTALRTYKDSAGERVFAYHKNDEYIWGLGLTGYSPEIQRAVIVNGEDFGVTYINTSTFHAIGYSGYIQNDIRTNSLQGTFIHESVGHGLGLLTDEYENTSGMITDKEITQLKRGQSQGIYHNVSLTNDPQQVYWSHLIGHPRYSYVGIHEGGNCFGKGVWRSEQESMMRYKLMYFNAISRELIVRRIMDLSGEEFTFEKFMEKDSDEGRSGTASAQRMPARGEQAGWEHHSPVLME